jgi:hypothetical protein
MNDVRTVIVMTVAKYPLVTPSLGKFATAIMLTSADRSLPQYPYSH